MKINMLTIFLCCFLCLQPKLLAEVTESPVTLSLSQNALIGLGRLSGFEADPTLKTAVDQFFALPLAEDLDEAARAELLEKRGIALWGASIEEFIGLADLLFADSPSKARDEKSFASYRSQLKALKAQINTYIAAIHPGFAALEADTLKADNSGRGITIAVFDVFDMTLLKKQRSLFPKATIEAPLSFGRPLELSHGNTVIDVILQLAPEARIIPVWSDAALSSEALAAVALRSDIDIVNMSRAFSESADHHHIEPAFKKALLTLRTDRIVTKALGNSGTDLEGRVTGKRQALGLGPVNNLASYDLALIADAYTDSEGENGADDLLLFGLNLSLFAEDIALSASIPGANGEVAARTLGVPAEGVWSPSSESFESGSSFAAPQLAGLTALLLEAVKRKYPGLNPKEQKYAAVKALKDSADRKSHGSEVWGLGLPSARKSLDGL